MYDPPESFQLCCSTVLSMTKHNGVVGETEWGPGLLDTSS